MPNQSRKIPSKPDILAVTPGDPEGIGPEIIAKSLGRYTPGLPMVIVGQRRLFPSGIEATTIESLDEVGGRGAFLLETPVEPGQDPSFAWVRRAVDLALDGRVKGIVTGPIGKHQWWRAGIPFAGHTGYLAERAKASRYAMFFWAEDLKVALFTTHQPLREIFASIRRDRIVDFIAFIDSELKRLFGHEFRFFVCGLNPHAGEDGLLGDEEKNDIAPALEELKGKVDIAGLFSADVIFPKARKTENSVVVAWYHDQGLIPFKQLHFRDGVNLTLGLPFVRTSPDHGPARDIAGQGIADSTSMLSAIQLAENLVS